MSEYVVLEQEMKDMADTVTKYIPKISDALEEIALGLNYFRRLENDAVRNEDPPVVSMFTKDKGILDGKPGTDADFK